jgi:hypothetical protein
VKSLKYGERYRAKRGGKGKSLFATAASVNERSFLSPQRDTGSTVIGINRY